jgi:DNA-binding MarR family transcriptional regulator
MARNPKTPRGDGQWLIIQSINSLDLGYQEVGYDEGMPAPDHDRVSDSVSAEGVSQDIDELLFALTRQLYTYREAQLAPFELTYPQAQVLRALSTPLPMSELADRLHCTGSNVTGIVDRLQARGLLERRTPASDRRVKQLAFTDAGVALQRRVEALMSAAPAPYARSPAELVRLRELLRQFLDQLRTGMPVGLEAGAPEQE